MLAHVHFDNLWGLSISHIVSPPGKARSVTEESVDADEDSADACVLEEDALVSALDVDDAADEEEDDVALEQADAEINMEKAKTPLISFFISFSPFTIIF